MSEQQSAGTIAIERRYPVSAEQIWNLWTTAVGIESWWAPEGFRVDVSAIELRPGGELVYTMTAVGTEQIEFMKSVGLPLSSESRKRFLEVESPRRLSYTTLADFIPGVDPYEFLTVVDLNPSDNGVYIRMTVDRMHDEEWTQRLVMGRQNELDNLGKLVGSPE